MTEIPEQSPSRMKTEEELDEEFESFINPPNPSKKKNTRNITYTPIRQERYFNRPERTDDESKYNLLQKFIWFSN